MAIPRVHILLAFSLLLSLFTRGQDQWALSSSEYLPSVSTQLNPAFSADPKVYLSIHLAGVQGFAFNDLTYYRGEEFSMLNLISGTQEPTSENLEVSSKKGLMDASIEGPAAHLSLGRSSIGLSTRLRSSLYVEDIPYELGRFLFHGFRFFPQYDQSFRGDNSAFSTLTWGELSLNLSHMVKVTNDHHLNVGVNVKRLYGIGHVSLFIDRMDYLATSEDLFIRNFSGEYAISDFAFRGGNGWGMDMGVIFKKTIKGRNDYIPFSNASRCRTSDYRYLVGLSINDIGKVCFQKNSFRTEVVNGSIDWLDYIDTEVYDLESLDELLLERVEDDQNVSSREVEYAVRLPRSVVLHGDLNLDHSFHLSAGAILPWNTGVPIDMKRYASFNLTPRYIRSRFEFGMPLSLIDYEVFRLGFGFRYQWLYLGSDDFLRLVSGQDVYGADAYVGLHIPIYGSANCGGSNRRRGALIAPCWGQ